MRSPNRADFARGEINRLLQDGKSGTRLPSEAELASTIGVSRKTVRDALNRLWLEGSVIRRWGVGTFIADRQSTGLPHSPFRSIYLDIRGLRSLPDNIESAGRRLSLQRFATELTAAPPWTQTETGFTGPVWRVQRWLSIDDAPAMVANDYLPQHIGGRAVEPDAMSDLHVDLTSFLRRYGVRVVKQEAVFDAALAQPELAEALRVPEGTALIYSKQKTITELGETITCSELFYRSDVFNTVLVRTVND